MKTNAYNITFGPFTLVSSPLSQINETPLWPILRFRPSSLRWFQLNQTLVEAATKGFVRRGFSRLERLLFDSQKRDTSLVNP